MAKYELEEEVGPSVVSQNLDYLRLNIKSKLENLQEIFERDIRSTKVTKPLKKNFDEQRDLIEEKIQDSK